MQRAVPVQELTIDAEWLDRTRQPASVRASFWGPLAVSIMNERVETAQAAAFLDALRIAFLGHWHHAALVFPQAGLSSIFADPATRVSSKHMAGRSGATPAFRRLSRMAAASRRCACATARMCGAAQ